MLAILVILLSAMLTSAGAPADGAPADGAPADEWGLPLTATWATGEIGAHDQNWAVDQDDRGVMYFANSDGVLEFDGVSWRLIHTASNSLTRLLAVGHDGKVYVGAVDELGRLERDELGRLRYVSLLDRLPADERRLGDVWRVIAASHGIYFWTRNALLRWHDDRFTVWPVSGQRPPALVDDRLYLNQPEIGLTWLDGDEFRALPGGEPAADLQVMSVLPRTGGGLLVGARQGGLFELVPVQEPATEEDSEAGVKGSNEKKPRYQWRRFPTAVDTWLGEHRLYHAARLPDGRLALASMSGGAAVIDAAGELLHLFDKSTGLPDSSVWYLFVDREGALWTALNRGLARLEISSPWTRFGESQGLAGRLEDLARHRGRLYAATSAGLLRLGDGGFAPVEDSRSLCWSLLPFTPPGTGDELLLAGCFDGVYAVGEGPARQVAPASNAFELFSPPADPWRIYVGEAGSLTRLRYAAGSWVAEGPVAGCEDDVRDMTQGPDGRLWLATHLRGLLRMSLDENGNVVEVKRYGLEHGLPNLNSLKLARAEGRLLVAAAHGLLVHDPRRDLFEPLPFVAEREMAGGEIDALRITSHGGAIWLSHFQGGLSRARLASEGVSLITDSDLARLDNEMLYSLLPGAGNVLWAGGREVLFRWSGNRPRRTEVEHQTVLRGVLAHPAPDAQDAALTERLLTHRGAPHQPLRAGAALPYAFNSLVFTFALPAFDAAEQNLFSYFLEGYDADWTPFAPTTTKEYTHLPEGSYRFRVRGRDVYGRTASEAVIAFTVRPPWFRTLWAYLAYVVAAAAVLAASVKLRGRHLERQRDRLREQHAILEHAQAEREALIAELAAKNDELERFASTVAHDFRSPLVTIEGFLRLLKKDLEAGDKERAAHNVDVIHQATGQLSRLLEGLLALSRAGRSMSAPQAVPLGEVAREAIHAVGGRLAERGVEIEVAEDPPVILGDRLRLLQVYQNLLDNAVKFMGRQPHPKIEIGWRHEAALVECRVADNGRGIDPRDHERVFQVFEHSSEGASTGDGGEGSGIGLAVVQRVVEAHGGRIWIESEGLGKGTAVRFTLPTVQAGEPSRQSSQRLDK